jgi:DNA-binding NarL/FixJ family response regulator
MINIMLAEDHEILRDGLKSLLKDEQDLTVVEEAKNGQEVILKIPHVDVHVVIMDINMPIMNGLETTKYLHEHHKDIKILVLSMMDNDKYLSQMFEAGASGYLLKSTSKEELIYAIKKVAKGGTYVCSEMTLNILEKPKTDGKSDLDPNAVSLSKREIEVLRLIAEGMTSKEIAKKQFTSTRTVETHRMNLIEKTKSKNTAALVKFAILNGFIKG